MQPPISVIEKVILDQVKFLNTMLEESRKRNKMLREILDASYAKLVGLGTPYEECIFSLRQVRADFDSYLSIIRDKMAKEAKADAQRGSKKRKPPYRP